MSTYHKVNVHSASCLKCKMLSTRRRPSLCDFKTLHNFREGSLEALHHIRDHCSLTSGILRSGHAKDVEEDCGEDDAEEAGPPAAPPPLARHLQHLALCSSGSGRGHVSNLTYR